MPSFARTLLFAASLTTLTSPAMAQTPRWEIEAYGGVASRTLTGGETTPPPAGAALVTSNPIFPTRQVPSWFFGDGALLLNDVAAVDGSARIAPLDALFAPPGTKPGGAAGVRLRYRLSSRLAIELGVDAGITSEDRVVEFDAVVEASRSSFIAAFADQLASGPFVVSPVDAAATTSGAGTRRHVAVTASLVRDFGGRLSPFVLAGAGVVTGAGSLPSAALEGRYRFSILGQVPVDETDRVSLRYTRDAALTAVFGGGIRRTLSGPWGWTIDARVLVGPDATRIIVDARPASVTGTPSGFIQTTTNPSVQFSNNPAIGRQSTLGGGLDGHELFGGGIAVRPLVTFGIVRRF